jgi:peptidyl-prolyl cis-trans isomerase A (cyclophilin A)
MIRSLMLVAACAALGACEAAPVQNKAPVPVNKIAEAPKAAPLGDIVRVRLETELGAITLELDHAHAPTTTANFVRYVDEHRLDGAAFYRAARTRGAPGRGFIQGGIRRTASRLLPAIPHEPTSQTGLRHVAGAISMAQNEPGQATAEFFITANEMPGLDARRGAPGFAAFGRVTEGMDVVRRILAAETVPNVGSAALRGQMIRTPIMITRVTRVE